MCQGHLEERLWQSSLPRRQWPMPAAVAVPGTTKGPPRRLRWLGRHQDLRQEEGPVLHCQDKPKVQEEPKVLQEEPQVLLRAALPPLRP